MAERKDESPRDAEIDLNIDRALFPEIFGNMSEADRERIMQHREQFPNDLKHRNQHRLNRANRYLGERDVLGEAEAYHRYINEPLQPPKKQKNIGVKSMPDTPQKQQQQGPEPYSAQVLRRVFADKNTLLQQYHDMMGPMECPKGRKILEKVLQGTVGHLDAISDHWKNHELYQGLPPLEDDVEEDELLTDKEEGGDELLDEEGPQGVLSPEEAAMLAAQPADPNEVGETMRTKLLAKKKALLAKRRKDFTKDEAEEVKDEIDEEVEDDEDDKEESDEGDEDGDEKGKGKDEAEEDLDESEKEAVMESLDFLKGISEPYSTWGPEHQMKAYHYHKLLDKIGAKAHTPKIYGVHPPADVSGVSDDQLREQTNRDIRNAGQGDTWKHEEHSDWTTDPYKDDPFKSLPKPPTVNDQLSKLLKDIGGAKQPEQTNEQFHKSAKGMSADVEAFATKRAACKGCAKFLKDLSSARWMSNESRQKGLSWHKDLEGLLTSKDGEEELQPSEDADLKLDLDSVGEMGEKARPVNISDSFDPQRHVTNERQINAGGTNPENVLPAVAEWERQAGVPQTRVEAQRGIDFDRAGRAEIRKREGKKLPQEVSNEKNLEVLQEITKQRTNQIKELASTIDALRRNFVH